MIKTMKKKFLEKYALRDDPVLTDNFTCKQLGFFVDPKTYTVRFLPEFYYKKVLKKKSFLRKAWESFTKGIRLLSVFNRKKEVK